MQLPRIEQLLEDDAELLTLPSVVYEILALIDSPDSSVEQIVEKVSQDAALTVRVLRMVNSAYYGLPMPVSNVEQAITLIGLKTLRDIVLVSKVAEKFSDIPAKVANMTSFWNNSLMCAGLAKRFYKEQGLKKHNIFSAALLNNVGILVMLQKMPSEMQYLLKLADKHQQNLYDAEQLVLGYTHADVGAMFMSEWGMPELFVQVAKYRDNFYLAGEYDREAAIVHLAASHADSVMPLFNLDGLQSEPDLAIYDFLSLSEESISTQMKEIDNMLPETQLLF